LDIPVVVDQQRDLDGTSTLGDVPGAGGTGVAIDPGSSASYERLRWGIFCGADEFRGDARMRRFWRDGLRGQRAEASSRAAPETSGLLADALEHEPIDAEMWSRVGTMLVRRAETMRGAAAFRIALRLDPNHSETHRLLATVLAVHGSSAEAAAHYERFLGLTERRRDAQATYWG
jgi:Tfp pilus assembly protein PilF